MQPSRFIQQTISCGMQGDSESAGGALCPCPALTDEPLQTDSCQSGKPRFALTEYHAKITTRRNRSEWSVLEKPVASYRVLPLPELVSWF
jgi:hypothetical protein